MQAAARPAAAVPGTCSQGAAHDTETAFREQSDDTQSAENTCNSSDGQHKQQQQRLSPARDASTCSTRDLIQSALAHFMPPQEMPGAAAAAAASTAMSRPSTGSVTMPGPASGSAGLPVLPHLADCRELQLVAAAFAAGAAAGAAGKLQAALPLLEQFSSGDVSNCGYTMEDADDAEQPLPEADDTAAAAAQHSGGKKRKAGKGARSSSAANKSIYR